MQQIFDDAIRRLIPNLNSGDQRLLQEHAIQVINTVQTAFGVNELDLRHQLTATKNRDSMAIINLLLPRVAEEDLQKITSLNMLFKPQYTRAQWDRCHRSNSGEFHEERLWDVKYFKSNFKILLQTIYTVSHKLHPNWVDIIPITLDEYQKSNVFQKTIDAYYHTKPLIHTEDERQKAIDNYVNATPAGAIGIRDMWSVVSTDLFANVLSHKMLIYDYNFENEIGLPTVSLLIWDRLLPLDTIYDELKWNEITDTHKRNFTEAWEGLLTNLTKERSTIVQSGVANISYKTLARMFRVVAISAKENMEMLLRGTSLEGTPFNFNIIQARKQIIDGTEIENAQEFHGTLDWHIDIGKYKNEVEFLIKAIRSLPPMAWYLVLFKAIQELRMGWYGLILFEGNRPIKVDFAKRDMRATTADEIDLFRTYDDKKKKGALDVMRETMKRSGCLLIIADDTGTYNLTIKNVYNWAKLIVNYTDAKTNKFVPLPTTWDAFVVQDSVAGKSANFHQSAIRKLFGRHNILNENNNQEVEWLTLKRYHRLIYFDSSKIYDMNLHIKNFHSFVINSMTLIFPHIVIQTLIKRGTLTAFCPIASLTNQDDYHGSEEKRPEWLRGQLVDSKGPLHKNKLKSYTSAYNFVNSRPYDIKYIGALAKQMSWYTAYAMNWVSQISFFHRFLNCRFSMITGGTGVGKTTQGPKLMLYALRALEGRSRARVMCTQPRIDLTTRNAGRVSEEMGIPITDKFINPDGTVAKDKEDTSNCGVGYKYSGGELGLGAPIQLIFCTDGSLITEVLTSLLMKSTRVSADGKVKVSKDNLYDVFMIDEAHEHNIFMDLILSKMRPHLYHNPELRFCLMSATLTKFDEERYRSFFRDINDNLRYPFSFRPEGSDRIDIDRLIHIAAPFMGTQYTITTMPHIDVMHGRKLTDNTVMQDIIKEITNIVTSLSSGTINDRSDMIVFLPGQREIANCCEAINNSPGLGSGTIAIPYFKNLAEPIRDLVTHIDNEDYRKKIVWSRNDTMRILYTNDLVNKNHLPEGRNYRQFVIVATNIAEASITINSLKYVIDSGLARSVTYNPTTRTEKTEITLISKFNSTQRKGRVGRVSPGTAYFLYDPNELEDGGALSSYAISSGDISEQLLNMIDPVILKINQKMLDVQSQIFRDGNVYDFIKEDIQLGMIIANYKFVWEKNITEVLHNISDHNDSDNIKEILNRIIDSQYTNANTSAVILFDYEMRLYCFHPEEPFIIRDMAGIPEKILQSNSRRIRAQKRSLNGVHTFVIMSELIDDGIKRLAQLGIVSVEGINKNLTLLGEKKDVSFGSYSYSVIEEERDIGFGNQIGLVQLNNLNVVITDLGKQTQALVRMISNELTSDDNLEYGMSDVLLLLYAHRYKCLPEILKILTMMRRCDSAAGPNPMAWAPLKEEFNNKTGKIMRNYNVDGLFNSYRHASSDHLAFHRMANVIQPLYNKIFGDGLNENSIQNRNTKTKIRTEYERLLSYKSYIKSINGVIVVNVKRSENFSSSDAKALRKIIESQNKYGDDSITPYEKFSTTKHRFYTAQYSADFLKDKRNHILIDEYAKQNNIGDDMMFWYMRSLQFLQNAISKVLQFPSRSLKDKELAYPNTDPKLLTLETNMYVCGGASLEEAIIRSFLYANPDKIAFMDKKHLYYQSNVEVRTKQLYGGNINGFTNPHGICLFSGIAESSKLEEVDEGIEVSIEGVSTMGEHPLKAGVILSIFTNIPHEWLGQCNPQMNIDKGFTLSGLSNRAMGMNTQHSMLLQDDKLNFNPW
jgi:hypothetical protein